MEALCSLVSSSYGNKNKCGVGIKNRSEEQNREPRNKPCIHDQVIYDRTQEYTVGKEQSLQ